MLRIALCVIFGFSVAVAVNTPARSESAPGGRAAITKINRMMPACRHVANHKKLHGAARGAFMRSCLKS